MRREYRLAPKKPGDKQADIVEIATEDEQYEPSRRVILSLFGTIPEDLVDIVEALNIVYQSGRTDVSVDRGMI